MTQSSDEHDRSQMRLIGGVIAGAMLAWIGLQFLGSQLGWASKWVFLVDLAAIGAFIWALIAAIRLWRRRKDNG